MNFGNAIECVKSGDRVARAGWNGKGMFVWLNKGSCSFPPDAPLSFLVGGVPSHLFEQGGKDTATRMPNLNLRAADGSTVMGWLASQTDMLAEEWGVVAWNVTG